MGLQVWLPLINGIENQGLNGAIAPQLMGSGVTFTNGKIGNAATFPNSCNSCIYMDGLKLQTGSWCTWIKVLGEGSGTSQRIISEGRDTGSIGTNIFVNKAGTTLTAHTHKRALQTTISLNTWYHVAITFGNGIFSLYINGNLLSSISYTEDSDYAQSNDKLVLGKMSYSYTSTSNHFPLNGQLSDFRIYDHCLSPREVKEISKGLVLHYPLAMPGQENLVKQSNQFRVGTHAAKITPSLLEDGTYQVIAESGNSNYTSSWWMTLDGIENNFVEGEVFTVSFTIKSSDANTTTPPKIYLKERMGYFQMIGRVVESWSTVYYTGTWKKENSLAPHLGWYGLVGTYQISNWKLEKGSRPTPWLPNSTDPLYTAMGYNDGIEYDVSGFCNNGTKIGTFSCSSDTSRYNTSYYFNGDDSAIQFPKNDILSTDEVFTMNIWFKKDDLGAKNYETLVGGPSGFEMDTRAAAAQTLSLYMASLRGDIVFSPFNFGTWYMVTMVNDGTNELYYVNGELKKTIEKKTMPNGDYYIGAWQTAVKQNYKGLMSDFRIYKTALSADDVLALYQNPISLANTGTLLTQGEYVEV